MSQDLSPCTSNPSPALRERGDRSRSGRWVRVLRKDFHQKTLIPLPPAAGATFSRIAGEGLLYPPVILRRPQSGRLEGRTITRHCLSLVLALTIACALAGCGKKGAPVAPPGEPDTFPRVYPSE